MKNFISIAFVLAWNEIRQAYRRSKLGQYWLTIGMGVQIATIALVFSIIFQKALSDYLVFIAVGIIFWTYMSNALTEGSRAFIEAESMIKQVPIEPFIHVLKVQVRNLISLGHNFILIPLVSLTAGFFPSAPLLLLPFGLAIVSLNLFWMSSIFAIVSARYRDFPPMVSAATNALFYLTHVMWFPDLLGNNQLAHVVLGLNPFYHLLQVIRQPILGIYPTLENWGIALLMAVSGLATGLFCARRFRSRIAYWV